MELELLCRPRERLVVALTDDAPEVAGQTWTADDYATRDAQLVRLGLPPVRRR